jgi:PAS domain S-box-containing protein
MQIDLDPATASANPTFDWTAMGSPAHSVQFYGDDTFLLDELSRYMGSALGAGDVGIVIATEAHRAALAQRLEERGIDLARAAAQGRYVAIDADEMLARFMRDGRPDAALFAGHLGGVIASAAGAAGRVAAFGEMVALLWARSAPQAALELEQLWNDLARTHRFDLRCAYPIHGFAQAGDTEPLAQICAAHSHVIPAESYTALIDDDQRARTITLLQHKAHALESEIEERKRAQVTLQRREAELADFLENAVEGVQQVGADGVITWANKALLRLLGYAAAEYAGRPLCAFFVDPAACDEFWARLLRREDVYEFAADLRCKDGSARSVLLYANGLWEGGELVHTRCFLHDVSEQKRMQRTLRQTNQALRAAVAARDEFLSVAAHELKTPVTSLRGFAQLLLRDIDAQRESSPQRRDAALRAIDQQSGKLSELVSRLLDTAQIEAGKLRLDPARTDLAALVRAVIGQRQDAGHVIRYQGPARLDAFVDPIRLEQVVTNLLGNAVKFSPTGGAITVALEQSENGAIRLTVTDEGAGVPPDQREAIFGRFYQAQGERGLAGMGLGLYITREIVELHGGSVRVEEPEQGGARFVVALPAPGAGA